VYLCAGTIVVECLAFTGGCSSSNSNSGANSPVGGAGGASLGGSTGGEQSGGSTSTTPSTVVTTVDTSKQLGNLTATEYQQLCRDTIVYNESQITAQQTNIQICTAEAIEESQSGNNCRSSYANCIATATDPYAAGTSSCDTVTVPTGCTATVAQYNACTQDRTAATKALFSQFGPQICDELDAGAKLSTTAPTPASCQILQTACPNF